MARKKSSSEADIAERRYLAMRARQEAGPRRTLGDMLALRRDTIADIVESGRLLDDVLDVIYEGAKCPPAGQSYSHRRQRILAWDIGAEGRFGVAVAEFSWSLDVGHWQRCWSRTHFRSWDDPEMVKRLVREARTELDELAVAFEFAQLMSGNDPELGRRFDAIAHRNTQLYWRRSVVTKYITSAVLALLEERSGWRARPGAPWVRLALDDGSIISVSDTGAVVFGDMMMTVEASLSERPRVERYGASWSLRERQQRAREQR